MKFSILKHKYTTSRRLITAAVFCLVIIAIPLIDALATSGKIYPGVRVARLVLGGQELNKANDILEQAIKDYLSQDIVFTSGDLRAALPMGEIVSIDAQELFIKAQEVGNTGSFLRRGKERIAARLSRALILPGTIVNTEALNNALRQNFGSSEIAPRDAAFAFDFAGEKPVVSITAATDGVILDLDKAQSELSQRARTLSTAPIIVKSKTAAPIIRSALLDPLLLSIQELFNRPPPEIKAYDKKWIVKRDLLSTWIKPQINEQHPDVAEIVLDTTKITDWIDTIAKEIETPQEDAVFELSPDGKKAIKFSLGRPGIAAPRPENAEIIAQAIMNGASAPIGLVLKTLPPKISAQKDAKIYGITELVGSGTTNFKGSPINRVKNIKRAAEVLNGILIEPGQEFSTNASLRPVTEENGYLPEMVIKVAEGRTVPEVGGGLCQIGTTMFRVALNSGLPITARQNHYYRVSYYEPPVGMDATIYDPAPDMKFINDTGNWLVLTTRIKGTEITFDFWGTKDGRQIDISAPVVSNIKRPPEKKIVATTDLEPGKTKCIERAHNGADAVFTYKVTYADGRLEEKGFFSRYQPWQEVCLLGVEKLSTITDDGQSQPPLSPP